MRLALSLLLSTCLAAVPPTTVPLAQALDHLLDQYDLTGAFPEPPGVAPKDRPALRWLQSALWEKDGENPFPKGTRGHREVLALRKLVAGDVLPADLPILREPGSQLRFWRWGAHLVRVGRWRAEDRRRFENHLLAPFMHPLLRGFGLRHALCFALEARDEARFEDLRARVGEDFQDVFLLFQTALALSGAYAPTLRLWSLPELAPETVLLARPGLRTIRIAQVRNEPLAAPPEDEIRILPTREGYAPSDEDKLDEASRQEILPLMGQLPLATDRVYLAPVRRTLEKFGLVYFPIELKLDGQGHVTTVRMGDAALAAPPAL